MRGWIGLWLGMLVSSLDAGPLTTNAVVAFSRSGQFVIQSPAAPPLTLSKTPGLLSLTPATTAVSCERIKQALLAAMDLTDTWRGKIRISLQSSMPSTQTIDIRAVYYPESWQYWMAIPREVENRKLVRAVVQVLLLELANRQAEEKSAETPLWLLEGMTGYLLDMRHQNLAVQSFAKMVREDKKLDPTLQLRERLAPRLPLSFTQLALPTPEMLQGDAWDLYQTCAELFLVEWLRLDDGPRRLQEFLQLLPHYQNWQMALLKTGQPLMISLLDVEKWWSLMLTGNERLRLRNAWPMEETLSKLDEILQYSAWEHNDTNPAPSRASVKIQQFVKLWDPEVQKDRLRLTLDQLNILATKGTPELLPLLEGYQSALSTYLLEQNRIEWAKQARLRLMHDPEPPLEKAIRRLDELDRRRSYYLDQIKANR